MQISAFLAQVTFMMNLSTYTTKLLQLKSFDFRLAYEIYQRQLKHNAFFNAFNHQLSSYTDFDYQRPETWTFLPIDAFRKVQPLLSEIDEKGVEAYFQSSGSTGGQKAKHYVHSLDLYKSVSLAHFYHYYPSDEFVILAFTPGYSDNPHSSLIQMLQFIIEEDASNLSSFLDLKQPQPSEEVLNQVRASGKRVLLFGAAFGLVDLAENRSLNLPEDAILIETGGMKTHRREMTRDQIKTILSEGLGIKRANIHSEYGMCELLSQAYETGDGWYQPPPWMKVLVKDPTDPLGNFIYNELGQIYVIDLANRYSCSFIQTQDKGIIRSDGSFQVLGRLEGSLLRGCNFLLEEEL